MPKKRTTAEVDAAPARRSTRIAGGAASAPNSNGEPKAPTPAPAPAPKAKKIPAAAAEKESEANGDAPPSKKTKVDEPKTVKLQIGDELPEGLVLKNELGEDVDVKEAFKEKGAVVFVYPKANTPGCTTQACGFRDIYSEIIDCDYQVFGLSMDSQKSQKNWQDKHTLQYHLLCDPKQELIKILGASKSASQVQRSHYIFGPGGKLLDVKSPSVPKDGPGNALDFIKALA